MNAVSIETNLLVMIGILTVVLTIAVTMLAYKQWKESNSVKVRKE